MINNYFIGVDYTEGKPETYKGVFCKHKQAEHRMIQVNTGDFDNDYEAVMQFLKSHLIGEAKVFNLSSIENYHIDSNSHLNLVK